MSSEAMLNIKEVVDRNVQYASIDDLQKKGKQRFKVMKLGQFYSLIERAVANVVERQALDIAEKDRQEIVDESNREFKRLFQERQAELQELQRKEDELVAMRTRLEQAVGEVESERRLREELERTSAARTQEFEQRLRQEVDRVRSQTEVLQQGESQLRQEVQRQRTEAEQVRTESHQQRLELEQRRGEIEQARATVQQQQQVLEQAKAEITQQRSENDASRMELQRVTLELDSERQRRAALEEAVRTTREHAETVSRDLDTGLKQRETEAQGLRQELQVVRQELQAEQSKVAEMDQVLRLAKERVEGNTRDLEETARSKTQAEQACGELEAQLAEARAEATATARRAEEFEARATHIAQEKGALTEDTRKIQESAGASERGRVEALERVSALEAELRTIGQQLAETSARYESSAALAADRERVILEKEQLIQELRAEIARLVAERDRLLESSQDEESERLRMMHEQFARLSSQLQEEKEQHQDTMKELLAETRAQKELFNEVRTLREQVDAGRAADGSALAGLSAQLGSLAPSLGEIQRTLEEGVPGKPGDTDVNDQIQAAIMAGMETIKDQINLHVEGVNEKRKKELEVKAVEAASVALDRLFVGGMDNVESNVEVVEVRQRKSGGIGDNLAKLRALKATAPVEANEGEES